jgi:hypothetical protein
VPLRMEEVLGKRCGKISMTNYLKVCSGRIYSNEQRGIKLYDISIKAVYSVNLPRDVNPFRIRHQPDLSGLIRMWVNI